MKNEETTGKLYLEVINDPHENTLLNGSLWYNYIAGLPLHLKVPYTVFVFHRQVLNGGINQYFFKCYGQFAFLTVQHLKLIGACKAADILERAIKLVNRQQYSAREFREKLFNRTIRPEPGFDDQLMEKLNELDNEYYALDENLEELLIGYLNRIADNQATAMSDNTKELSPT